MTTASVRELRQQFPRVLARLEAGEEVNITLRRRIVARLVPVPRVRKPKPKMPDIAARLKRVFGSRVISDQTMDAIIAESRGAL